MEFSTLTLTVRNLTPTTITTIAPPPPPPIQCCVYCVGRTRCNATLNGGGGGGKGSSKREIVHKMRKM